MAAIITKAGERLIAEKQAAHEVLLVSRFVLALVPGLDPLKPVDRDAPAPPPEQVVHTQIYTQKGFVNPNQVVYSLMMGSDIGDFDWNWIGLVSSEGVLLAVAHVPVQQKRRNIPPHQIGNNVTRNMLLVFDGAQALTDVTIDASTWQHDFTVRLQDIDERERLANRDVFGRACFFADGLQVVKVEGGYQLKAGLAFVEGLRVNVADAVPVTPDEFPTQAWLDVALIRQENSAVVVSMVRWGTDASDYVDFAGVQHYLIALADLPDSKTVVDRRTVEPILGPLVQAFAFRQGDYKTLRARATTKEDVGLGKLPNAISDDPDTNSSEILATTAALNKLNQQISDALVGMVASFDMETAPPGWLVRDGANVSRTAYAKLFAVIGTRYGAGDGSTTFCIGDSRGVFIRALDKGRGLNPGRALGSLEQGQNAAHSHRASAALDGAHMHTLSAVTAASGEHSHAVSGSAASAGQHYHYDANSGWVTHGGNATGGAGVGTGNPGSNSAGAHTHVVSGSAAPNGSHTHSVSGTTFSAAAHTHAITLDSEGGSEARPINQALLVCIKY